MITLKRNIRLCIERYFILFPCVEGRTNLWGKRDFGLRQSFTLSRGTTRRFYGRPDLGWYRCQECNQAGLNLGQVSYADEGQDVASTNVGFAKEVKIQLTLSESLSLSAGCLQVRCKRFHHFHLHHVGLDEFVRTEDEELEKTSCRQLRQLELFGQSIFGLGSCKVIPVSWVLRSCSLIHGCHCQTSRSRHEDIQGEGRPRNNARLSPCLVVAGKLYFFYVFGGH